MRSIREFQCVRFSDQTLDVKALGFISTAAIGLQ